MGTRWQGPSVSDLHLDEVSARPDVIDWLHSLPVVWMAIVIFALTYLVAFGIYWAVVRLAVGERLKAFKGISPGLLPPLGIIFGLLVAYLASQAWGDVDRAHTAINREASALRAVVLLADAFPEAPRNQLRGLVREHIRRVQSEEWPAMAERRVTLTMIPAELAQSLQAAVALPAEGAGQIAAQREIVAALQDALDARRQRILVSQAQGDWVKWTSLIIQAICTLIAVAMVHCDNRTTARLALGLFASAIAVSVLLIAAHDRPFTGANAITPTALLQVLPEETGEPAP
jgi:hypothetical protein